MIKILMINKFLYPNGGSETYMFKLAEELERKGNEVQFFGMDDEKRCVGNRINQYTLNMDFHDSSFLNKIKNSFKTIYSIEAKKKIRKVLEDFKPNVCHINNFNYQLTPSIILEIEKWRKEGNSCKIVYTAHDYQLLCPNHMFYNNGVCEKCLSGKYYNCFKGKCIHGSTMKSIFGALESYYWHNRKAYEYIDTIICCSEFLKKKMDTNPIFRNKTIMLHNFVENKEYKKCKKEDYILYFGRYSEEKGINNLIEVCKLLPNIKFVLAGKGPLEDEINKIDNVTNVGFKEGKELEDLIRKAKFSIYPSIWYENCPLSVMESIKLGTPVLGSNIGGIPELINNGVTGELFEHNNTLELKEKIEKLWGSNEPIDRYSNNCGKANFDSIENYYLKMKEEYTI